MLGYVHAAKLCAVIKDCIDYPGLDDNVVSFSEEKLFVNPKNIAGGW